MADEPEYTPEQEAEAEKIVAAMQARKAAEAQARRAAYLVPVQALVGGDDWASVLEAVQNIRASYAADQVLSPHVNALAEVMPRLAAGAGRAVTPSA